MIKRETGAVILGEKTGNCFGANTPCNDSVRKTFCHCEPKAKQSQAVACLPRIGEAGFSLVELIITMAVFVLVIAAASQVFTGLLTQFKQQSKIAETNIEGIVGLEILRQDIEHAGYGLPWNGLITYSESSTNPFSLNDAPNGTPRAIISQNNVTTYSSPNNIFNGSDYLVIKAINVAQNDTSQRWTVLKAAPFTAPYNPRQWSNPNENLAGTENVIVLSMGATTATESSLVVSVGSFSTQFSNVISSPWAPADQTITHIVYGITPAGTTPQRPFNRADYYIWRGSSDPAADDVPDRCAPNAGVLRKAVLNHSGTFAGGILPLLDCVADMQVDFWLDTDGDGDIDWPPSDNISALTAQQIRDQVKEVRVYIVAHEGQRDVNYDFSMGGTKEFLSATEVLDTNSRTINFVNLKTQIGNPDYKYYRWKLYTIVVKPTNLR